MKQIRKGVSKLVFNFENLDKRTRFFMLNEAKFDITNNKFFLSPRLSDQGRMIYPKIIKKAIQEGN